ncbi:MAG: hypothetical protein J4N95_04695 [Chloroflexi bacterium]|nr:hypothetical protein [Chloroflexota bacterium]
MMRCKFLTFALAFTLILTASVADQWPLDVAAPSVTAESIRGDVDGDGRVNSIDAFHLIQLRAGIMGPDPNEELYEKADLNDDGLLDGLDALLILQFHAGLIENL